MSMIIRIGVAGFAFIASVVTIYDNACKYAVNCPGTPETQSLAAPKPEVFVCNGRLTKHTSSVLTCEVEQNAGTTTAQGVMPVRPVERKQKLTPRRRRRT